MVYMLNVWSSDRRWIGLSSQEGLVGRRVDIPVGLWGWFLASEPVESGKGGCPHCLAALRSAFVVRALFHPWHLQGGKAVAGSSCLGSNPSCGGKDITLAYF